jgi:hypothetical protein
MPQQSLTASAPPVTCRSQTPSPSSGSIRSGRRASTSPAWRRRTRGGRWSCPATPATSTRCAPCLRLMTRTCSRSHHACPLIWYMHAEYSLLPAPVLVTTWLGLYLWLCTWLQCVELDFQYASEGIHRRWDAGFRITACAATPDQVPPPSPLMPFLPDPRKGDLKCGRSGCPSAADNIPA